MGILQFIVLILGTLLHYSNASERIIGAQTGTITQFPYLAQLQRRVGITAVYNFHCTGTLVSLTKLITAAHCFDGDYNIHPSQWRIRFGATNQLGTEPSAYNVFPNEILRHEKYNPLNYDNDIAVVGWQFPVWESANVKVMELNEEPVPPFSQVTIAGWGGINLAGAISNPLQFAIIPTIELTVCRMNYAWHSRQVTENMICAGVTGRGSCTNDRGLPLIYNGKLAGVSSWRIGCGTANQPGVFAVVLTSDEFLEEVLELTTSTVEPPTSE